MAERPPQTYANHGKIVPAYHYFAIPILGIHVLWTAWELITSFSPRGVVDLLVALALVVVGFYTRVFALKAQDRLIRLEELQRMETVLSSEAKALIPKIRHSLFVALRFAPDEELEGLMKRVAAGELTDRKSIKQAIQNWRPDHFRV